MSNDLYYDGYMRIFVKDEHTACYAGFGNYAEMSLVTGCLIAKLLNKDLERGCRMLDKVLNLQPKITQTQAKEFYRDLCGTIYGNANINSQGIMSEKTIAERMGISVERATEFLWACVKYGITERQGGAWVV